MLIRTGIEQAYVPYGSDRVVILEVRDARLRASLLDPITGEEQEISPVAGNLIPLAPRPDQHWVGQFYSSRQPGDICSFSLPEPDYHLDSSLSRVWDQTILHPETTG